MGQVLSPEALIAEIHQKKTAGQTVVVTNGCFDLLHVGHLRYLQAAKALGDLLVVAVNNDASVRELKGPGRPVVCEDDRAELLAGLACVDYVVLFAEQSPLSLLLNLNPDIYVKGAEYKTRPLPEAEALTAQGTRIELVEMVEARSTSNLVSKIQSHPEACGL